VNREPSLDELIEAGTTGEERERLQQVHELLLQAGPPPELTPELERGPTLGTTLQRQRQRKRRVVKQRGLLLLAAALSIALVFLGGYAVGNRGGRGASTSGRLWKAVVLKGTSVVPHAQATLQVWQSDSGTNEPMRLAVDGLPRLPGNSNYEVYLFRNGRIGGQCGSFTVKNSSGSADVTLNSPYSLRPGDSWVVTRPGAGGSEPGQMVLRPVKV
jgi:hypothetical protein